MKNLNALFSNQNLTNPGVIHKPKKVLIICFTPRSGSSLLTELVAQTGLLGRAGEYLNPAFIPNILKVSPASNPLEYLVRILNHTKSENEVSSIEVTWFHLTLFFKSLAINPMLHRMPWPLDISSHFIYLNRENFVAQAISLYKATETGLFHTTQLGQEQQNTEYPKLHFDGEKIKHWCEHLLQQEFGFEKWFSAHGIHPLRIRYEDFIQNKKLSLTLIGDHVGVNVRDRLMLNDENKSEHRKLSDNLNLDFEKRFVADYNEFVNHWKRFRGLQSPFSNRERARFKLVCLFKRTRLKLMCLFKQSS